MHYTYILRLSNGTYYTGLTDNVENRLKRHNAGDIPSTRKYRPTELVFFSAFPSRELGATFEKYLKTGSGQAFRNKHLIKSP